VSSSGGDSGRVLIADSHPAIAGALSWLLREQGYWVASVADAGSLIENIERVIPDVIVVDDEVMQTDHALLDRLRSERQWSDVRIIVAAPADSAVALPSGADDFVTKPIRVPELLGRVRTQLRASSELRNARAALRDTSVELERVRGDAIHNRQLIEILHEVTGELTPAEIYRILARRVARSLGLSHCSVVLAHAGDLSAIVAASAEDSSIQDVEVPLDRYPEIIAALKSERPVLVDDALTHPLFAAVREMWAKDGKTLVIRSVAAIPFSLDRARSGVLFLRTDRAERRLTTGDIEFAEVVIRGAVAAIRRAQALETTRADNRRLEALATTDQLTRVLNRRALLDRLGVEIDRARRYESGLSMLLLDVDFFKKINDTAGHLTGDSVLQQLGALLEGEVRNVDLVARYGGEEFVVILPQTSLEGGVSFAERLRERIGAQQFVVGTDSIVHLTVSVGIATFPSVEVQSMEDLFARADEALYRAKSAGRNQVRT
jgi:two-component system cell cycle response regulator